jgi:hypothetical protein
MAEGSYSGLIVNTEPVVPEGLEAKNPVTIDTVGFHVAGARGGWNTRPAIQYVARGRRPFGPYRLDLFGSPRLPKDRAPLGTGHLWLRVADGTRVMSTAVENPTDAPLSLELTTNGATQHEEVPAHSTQRIETPLHDATDLSVTLRGDRRLILRETAFR